MISAITVACGSVLMTWRLWHQRALTLMENCIPHPFCILRALICAHPSVSKTLLYYTTLRYTWALSLLLVVVLIYPQFTLIWLFLHTQRGMGRRKPHLLSLKCHVDYVVLFLDCLQATIQSVHYQLFSCRRAKWGSTWHVSSELNFRDGGLKYLRYGLLTVTFSFDLHRTANESKHHLCWLQNSTMAGTMEK